MITRNPIAIVVVLALFAGALEGQVSTAPNVSSSQAPKAGVVMDGGTPPGHPPVQQRDPRYRLCTGDVLQLYFPFAPEFDQAVTVQPDGFIILRAIGDVYVQGQSIPEVTQTLRSAYQKILHEPAISIELKDFEKPYYIAAGEVSHPGKYDLRGDVTVTQAVALAGGFNAAAKPSHVVLFHRVSNDWVEVKQLNVKKMLKSENLTEDVHLQPGDMLYVPTSSMSHLSRFIPNASVATYVDPTRF